MSRRRGQQDEGKESTTKKEFLDDVIERLLTVCASPHSQELLHLTLRTMQRLLAFKLGRMGGIEEHSVIDDVVSKILPMVLTLARGVHKNVGSLAALFAHLWNEVRRLPEKQLGWLSLNLGYLSRALTREFGPLMVGSYHNDTDKTGVLVEYNSPKSLLIRAFLHLFSFPYIGPVGDRTLRYIFSLGFLTTGDFVYMLNLILPPILYELDTNIPQEEAIITHQGKLNDGPRKFQQLLEAAKKVMHGDRYLHEKLVEGLLRIVKTVGIYFRDYCTTWKMENGIVHIQNGRLSFMLGVLLYHAFGTGHVDNLYTMTPGQYF